MASSPDSTLVGVVANIVFDTFEVSESEARECAEGLVLLADGWGESQAVQDWSHVVKKHLANRFKWRSETVRQRFLEEGKATVVAYESYIRARK